MSFISLMNKTQFIPRIVWALISWLPTIIMIIAADNCRCTKHPDTSFFVAPYVSTMAIAPLMMYKQDPQVCKKLQHSMASNQLTGFESLWMDVITSSGLCACSFWWDTICRSSCWLLVTWVTRSQTPVPMGGQEKLHNHMAHGYIYQMQIWHMQM